MFATMFRNFLYIFLYIDICFLMICPGQAQISHGGQPLPLTVTKSATEDWFVELPPFDLEEQLRIDSLEATDFRNGYRFAYKFMTDYTPENSGTRFTLSDGTRVWRLGIRSQGALSLNLLFSSYHVPEGAKLFLYNSDQTDVRGAFNHLNNSDLGLLPVAPIEGEELIIEYQEPADAEFPGELVVGEVNHGYRDFRISGPQEDLQSFACMPAIACLQDTTDRYDEVERSVVLLIIDGSIGCTGTLVNNTANDGTPYLLTASHCLNRDFTLTNPDYATIAGSVVCYFNYNSPQCEPVEPGRTDQTLASAYCRAVNEQTDMALLEMLDTPPEAYGAYYAGWNAQDVGTAPYACIHHPQGAPKRVSLAEGIERRTFYTTATVFDENAHWLVSRWTAGCTAAGSSGSPLFDADNRVLGGLTGGQSLCNNPVNDYFFALQSCWDEPADSSRQLQCWLDPLNSGTRLCEGLNPDELKTTNIRITSSLPSEEVRISANGHFLHIAFAQPVGEVVFTLFTLDGKAMRQRTFQTQNAEVEVGTLPAGVYIAQFVYQGKRHTQKILL